MNRTTAIAILFLSSICWCGNAFSVSPNTVSVRSTAATIAGIPSSSSTMLNAKFNASKSGSKRERLDKLAAMEDQKIETDKGFVLKAAGGFVGLCLILCIGALATGVFDDLLLQAM
mmetsp:Transcript_3890/g.5803  ORF Transcript_3890/g.5803 Transcript_3890/m.5803 type:complete len:116 (+) Transcript_3890:111-458(+)